LGAFIDPNAGVNAPDQETIIPPEITLAFIQKAIDVEQSFLQVKDLAAI